MAGEFVLILEEHRDLRDLLGVVLSRRGFAVAGAATVEAAAAVLRTHEPTAVLLAHPPHGPVRCPLPSLRRPTAPPTIVMTTRELSDDTLRREFGNYAGCLVKPIDPEELLREVIAVHGRILGPDDRGRKQSGTRLKLGRRHVFGRASGEGRRKPRNS